MNILFCVELYYPSVGGAQVVVRQLAERLASAGHEVTVATTRLAERASDTHKGVRIVGFDVRGNQTVGMRGEVQTYQNFLTNTPADVLFIYAAQQWTFDAAIPVLDRIHCAKVFVPCGYSGLYRAEYADYYRNMPNALRQMDAVVYHAESYRDVNFAKTHGLTNHVTIPNGADTKEFDTLGNPGFRSSIGASDQDVLLLTVGSFTGSKGHQEVAEAFALADFGSRSAFLILNGNDPMPGSDPASAQLRALAQEVGWPRALRHKLIRHLMPWRYKKEDPLQACIDQINSGVFGRKSVLKVDLPRDQLLQAFLQSDLFVFASNIEYSPLVLFEACAAGLPFLSVPAGNAREIAMWTSGGKICEAPIDSLGYCHVSPSDLAQGIEAMLADPDELKRLSEQGKYSSRQRFNWDALALEYERLFLALTKQTNDSGHYPPP
ncbi:glycosyltransferase family 4 protein [Aquipseudomonas alcaligenes]|uniref:glycosyltransferase family 4 protein n=1 Tax=Aquipseudomonas alcaligenes TaxID=43263 RepID=UPI003747C9F9